MTKLLILSFLISNSILCPMEELSFTGIQEEQQSDIPPISSKINIHSLQKRMNEVLKYSEHSIAISPFLLEKFISITEMSYGQLARLMIYSSFASDTIFTNVICGGYSIFFPKKGLPRHNVLIKDYFPYLFPQQAAKIRKELAGNYIICLTPIKFLFTVKTLMEDISRYSSLQTHIHAIHIAYQNIAPHIKIYPATGQEHAQTVVNHLAWMSYYYDIQGNEQTNIRHYHPLNSLIRINQGYEPLRYRTIGINIEKYQGYYEADSDYAFYSPAFNFSAGNWFYHLKTPIILEKNHSEEQATSNGYHLEPIVQQ